jgi:hypothetical protein
MGLVRAVGTRYSRSDSLPWRTATPPDTTLEPHVGTRTYGISISKSKPAIVLLVGAYAISLIIIFLRTDSDTWPILVIPTLLFCH